MDMLGRGQKKLVARMASRTSTPYVCTDSVQ